MRLRYASAFIFVVSACSTAEVNFASTSQDASDTDLNGDAATSSDASTTGDGTNPNDADQNADGGVAACNCASGDTCCIPPGAAPFCVAAGDTTSCAAVDGLGFACVEGKDGRECCLSSDRRSSFMAASCDGGAQLCQDPHECSAGSCVAFTCRTAQLSICSNQTAACPP